MRFPLRSPNSLQHCETLFPYLLEIMSEPKQGVIFPLRLVMTGVEFILIVTVHIEGLFGIISMYPK